MNVMNPSQRNVIVFRILYRIQESNQNETVEMRIYCVSKLNKTYGSANESSWFVLFLCENYRRR